MRKKTLKVEILAYTPNPLDVIYSACRQCYSPSSAISVFCDENVPREKKISLVKKVLSSGHESPLEHVSFTFAIEGISRACSHQLVRHRLASYSQQSQRYVRLEDLPFIIPPIIEKNDTAREKFIEAISILEKTYRELVTILENEYGEKGEKILQDARYILPNACETKIVVTMNARELIHFFENRCCSRAQWEIRNLAYQMLELVRGILPEIFNDIEAKCARLGYCPEGPFTCGKYPTKEEVLKNDREKA